MKEEKTPHVPEAKEAEQHVLAGLIVDPRCFADVDSLTPESFGLHHHANLFRLLQEMYSQGDHIDEITVPERVAKGGHHERYKSLGYVIGIASRCIPGALFPLLFRDRLEPAHVWNASGEIDTSESARKTDEHLRIVRSLVFDY